MKNPLSKLTLSVSTVASLMVGILMVAPVLAAPTGNPPDSNVNANFNSVTTGILLNPSAGLNVNNSRGLYVMDDAGQNGFQVLPNGTFNVITTTNGTTTTTNVGNVNTTVSTVSANQLSLPFTLKNASNQTVFRVDSNGDISNPTNSLVSFPDGISADTRGVSSNSSFNGGIGVEGTSTGTYGWGGYFVSNTTGVYGTGGTQGASFSNKTTSTFVNLATSDYGIDVHGPTNLLGDTTLTGKLTVSGHVKSTGGFGANLIRNFSLSGVAAGANATASVPCLTTEEPISCGFSDSTLTNVNWQLNYMYPTTTGCTLNAKNTSTTTKTLRAYAVCLNPNL